jgi:PPOX class probable F420-dependent enzyme
MPKPPLPEDLQEMLKAANPCVVASMALSGELHSAATWYEWRDDGAVLLNMDASRRRLGYLRNDPRVALTILDAQTWYRHVSLVGRVRDIYPDPNLEDIDRLSQHYRGTPYGDRNRQSWTAIVDVLSWHGWQRGRAITSD